MESRGIPSSRSMPLESSLMWVRGRTYTAHETTSGRSETLNSVPHRKVMGTMKMLVIRVRCCVLLVTRAARRPNIENIRPPAIITRKISGLGSIPGDMMHPTIRRTVQLMRDLTTPERVFPRITEDTLTGQSRSSSKLM